jgi:hypothetical protein
VGRFAVLLLVVSACSRVFGLDNPVRIDASSGDDDASTDVASLDAFPCFGHTGLCVMSPPSDRNFGAQTINTSAASSCTVLVDQPNNGPQLCVLIGRSVIVSGVVKAIGTRPLVILATETLSITMDGQIDVASRTAGMATTGAGANPTSCVDGENGVDTNNIDAGGGAGASFRGRGGDGGDADDIGGKAAQPLTSAPALVRGGCKGRFGGKATGAIAYDGGDGGGAVFLVAGTRIEVTGDINASGGGGKGGAIGGNANSGGAGGGSGGLIWLDAPIVIVTGDVLANGGGGGGASGALPGGTGGTSTDPATGGAAGTSGNGDGGNGAAGSILDAAPGVSNAAGGGGGGGGGGFIQIYSQSPQLTGAISPPPILM